MKSIKQLGNILFWLTLISPLLSFALVNEVGETDIFSFAGMIRYTWIMLLFIPIGVLSIYVGLKLKKSEQSYKKNIIIAVVCVPLLIIFGSYSFIFSGSFSYNIDTVIAIEEKTNLDLPDQVKIATEYWDSYAVSYLKIEDQEGKENFEQQLKTSPAWQAKLSSKIKTLWPIQTQTELALFDYFLFYNVSTGEYNSFPVDGEYDCIFIAYDQDLQRLMIIHDYIINVN